MSFPEREGQKKSSLWVFAWVGSCPFYLQRSPVPHVVGRWKRPGLRPQDAATFFLLPFRDLSNNQIAEIAPDAFQGLRSLNSL